MQDAKDQVVFTIIAVIIILLFLGVLFLVMLFYYNNKKGQMSKEKQLMRATFEKQLLESKLEIQEQTFDMISQEIHDNVGQILSLAKVQLGILEQRQDVDGELLGNVKESISQAMTELRDIADELQGPDGRVHWRDSRLEWPVRHGFMDFVAREFAAKLMMFPPDAT